MWQTSYSDYQEGLLDGEGSLQRAAKASRRWKAVACLSGTLLAATAVVASSLANERAALREQVAAQVAAQCVGAALHTVPTPGAVVLASDTCTIAGNDVFGTAQPLIGPPPSFPS